MPSPDFDHDLAAVLDAARILDDHREIPDDHAAMSIWAPRFCDCADDAVARGLLTFRPNGSMTLTEDGRAALTAGVEAALAA